MFSSRNLKIHFFNLLSFFRNVLHYLLQIFSSHFYYNILTFNKMHEFQLCSFMNLANLSYTCVIITKKKKTAKYFHHSIYFPHTEIQLILTAKQTKKSYYFRFQFTHNCLMRWGSLLPSPTTYTNVLLLQNHFLKIIHLYLNFIICFLLISPI